MTQPSPSSAFCIHASLMKPLSNISLSNIGFSLHSRLDYLNATVCFSLAARSYNDKLEAWEPLVEPVDGVLRCSPKYPCLYTKNCILGSTYLLIWDLQSISSIYVPVEAYLYFVDNGRFSVDGVLFDNPVTPSAAFTGVPFVDVVTTMLGPTIPLTTAEWEEWGDPRKEEFYFYMKSYSPVDNVVKSDIQDVIDKDGEGFTMVTKKAGNAGTATVKGISAESCPTSDLLVNNSDSGQTEVIESKCDTSVNSNLGNHDCLNPMNDILDTINNCHKRITLPYTGDKYLLHKQSTKWITVMTMAPPRLENGAGVLDKPVIEKTTPGRESEFDLRKSRKMAPPYRVMLHNDNYNKREYVVQVLMKLTRIGRDAVLYVESLVESIMGGFEELINILGSEGASTKSQLKLQMAFDGQERYMKRSWEPSDKADLHFVYKDVEGVSTQWDDIQRKLRNLPPKPSAFKPDPFTPTEDEDSKPKTKSQIDKKTEELKDLEDDLDDSCFLKEYKKRLAEMKQTVEV
ncbi:unnamed protein product [Lactuca saligna]|uniref:Uncharacterized protein n=1 Tax=Lactuca saligna TaxID=75948 RepID=A0AA35YUW5_LACSI|nr:unnamed protein product [Lactuca saligna]